MLFSFLKHFKRNFSGLVSHYLESIKGYILTSVAATVSHPAHKVIIVLIVIGKASTMILVVILLSLSLSLYIYISYKYAQVTTVILKIIFTTRNLDQSFLKRSVSAHEPLRM